MTTKVVLPPNFQRKKIRGKNWDVKKCTSQSLVFFFLDYYLHKFKEKNPNLRPITVGNPLKKLYRRIRHTHISKVLLLQI